MTSFILQHSVNSHHFFKSSALLKIFKHILHIMLQYDN